MTGLPTVAELLVELKSLERTHGPIAFDLGVGMVVALIGQIQLALRHPANTSEPAQMARAFVDDLIGSIGDRSPWLAEFLRLGDNPGCDQPADPEGR